VSVLTPRPTPSTKRPPSRWSTIATCAGRHRRMIVGGRQHAGAERDRGASDPSHVLTPIGRAPRSVVILTVSAVAIMSHHPQSCFHAAAARLRGGHRLKSALRSVSTRAEIERRRVV
jgi:hypothetical protein